MFPTFVEVTRFLSGNMSVVNLAYIQEITAADSGGSLLLFADGHKLIVKETLDEIKKNLARETAGIRVETYKQIAKEKAGIFL